MDAATFIALVSICAPLVSPTTAHAIVHVESSLNPNAIGVVGGALRRQPRDRAEALATARALQTAGRNFSVGIAQINVHNLDRLGLSLDDGFDVCMNLKTMQTILGECFDRAASGSVQSDLRRAFSCYYSGNYATGFRHGYVSRVVRVAANAQPLPRAPP